VAQKGTNKGLDGGDTRIMNAVYADKHIFYTQTTDVFNDGNQAGWLTVKLNTEDNSKEWDTLLWSEGNYYFHPALTLNGTEAENELAVFGSWSSADQYASGIVKIYTDHPNNSDGPLVNFKTGKAPYYRLSGGRNRWGDYSGASYDWTCGFAWGAVEIAGINNHWDTVVAARAFNDNDAPCVEPTKYTLTIDKIGLGDGVVVSDPTGIDCNDDCSKDYGADQSVTLVATANLTSHFAGWGDGQCDESEINTCTVAMEGNRVVTAIFESVCTLDNFEQDDSKSAANPILLNTPQNHSICPSKDNDWVEFTLDNTASVTLKVTGNEGSINLELYDNSHNRLEIRNSGSVKVALIDRICHVDALLEGTYYVKVNEAENKTIEEYTLLLDTSRCKDKLGDANGDGAVSILDVVKSINIVLVAGQPIFGADCNESGGVNIQDIVCTINKVLNLQN
jgi:hypothetical protein